MPGDRISRIHGALVTDAEVERVVRHLKAQGAPEYQDDVTSEAGEDAPAEAGGAGGAGLDLSGAGGDRALQPGGAIVLNDGKASTSYLQRKLRSATTAPPS